MEAWGLLLWPQYNNYYIDNGIESNKFIYIPKLNT